VQRRFLSYRKTNSHNTEKGEDPQPVLKVLDFITPIRVPLHAIKIRKLILEEEIIMKDVWVMEIIRTSLDNIWI
jgi:hypothetical protein